MPEPNTLRPDGRRHHYVPRLLLNRFGVERKKGKFQTVVFDKDSGTTFKTAVENAMVEFDFNALEKNGVRFSAEVAMGDLENRVAPIIDKILQEQSLAGISTEQHAMLCTFAALQNLRGPSLRNGFFDLTQALRERLASEEVSPEFEAEYLRLPDGEEQKISALQMLQDALPEFASHFAAKDLLLARTTASHPFIIGDTPVAMANDEDHSPYGNIGLAVRGIQIHLPLSPLFTLVFWCPSIRDKLEISWKNAEGNIAKAKTLLNVVQPHIRAKLLTDLETLEASYANFTDILNAIKNGAPLDFKPEHVERLNSLQVIFAQRWLAAPTDNFGLARRMISDDSRFKTRPKPDV